MMKKIEKNAYLVPGYACNHRCNCCPYNQEKGRTQRFSLKQIESEIDHLLENNVTSLTISGGEPTCHPEFIKITAYALSKDLGIQILTNGDKFSKKVYVYEFIDLIKGKDVGVTTTIHSFCQEIHERQNGSAGSFFRSINGLKTLDENGINISIKHCITQENYKDLRQFIEFVLNTFSEKVEIQLFGIDLCGIDLDTTHKMWVAFDDLQPYLESALKYFEIMNCTRNQILTVNAIPLCKCDCYYWGYFSEPNTNAVLSYKADDLTELGENFGINAIACNACIFNTICTGTYFSAFQVFGDAIVTPPQSEQSMRSLIPRYNAYNKYNISKTYFSPYTYFTMTKKGPHVRNRRTGESACMHLHKKTLLPFF